MTESQAHELHSFNLVPMLGINGTSNVGSLSLIFAVFCCIVVNMTVCITDRSVRLIRQKVGGVIYLQRYRTSARQTDTCWNVGKGEGVNIITIINWQ